MSTYVVPAARRRLASGFIIVLAVIAAVAIAVLGVLDATPAGSTEVRDPAPAVAPTPEWLQRYLEFEAPNTVPPTPPTPPGQSVGAQPANPGLR